MAVAAPLSSAGWLKVTFRVLVRRILRNLQDYGWWATLHKGLAYCVRFFFMERVYRIYRIHLNGALPRAGRDAHGFTFKILDGSENQAIEQIENVAEWLRGRLKDRVAAGDLCLAVLHQNKVAGFNLIAFGEAFIPLLQRKRTFRPGEAWSDHITVLREFRQQGLASELRYRIFEELRKRGIKRLYGGTLRSNLPSLMLTRRVGFREIMDVTYTRVLNCPTWRFQRIRT